MTVPAFDPKELEIVRRIPAMPGKPESPVYNFPVAPREAFKAMYDRKPIWQITGVESTLFTPKVIPDNIARAFVFDGTTVPGVSNKTGGKDMFGIDWEYVAQVGGSMVRPGKPLLEDANEWVDKVVWPDIDTWDWEGSQKANEQYLKTNNFVNCMFMNGWYERLITLMEFEGAIIAVIDEEQKDAVKAFLEKLSDLYIRILDKLLTYFPQIDIFCMHDDWGSQKDTFFSPETAAEMIVPYMRKVTDFIHSRGKKCELHSCGMLEKQVPNIIAAGWDSWNPQVMNDTQKIYEQYGDKILVAVLPDKYDPAITSEEEQRALARAYADKFCRPEKPSLWNMYGADMLTPAFREELYKQSRINYGKG
ncbi:methyltransferase [Dehalobacter sp. DCM]|uniref:uroporphyrinogen decarboxylase family protein n=1 Tax=Dehalobacter sp. DCM TaxID=2907827 RepID=UPI0030819E66|nr:methyltransferase [Dehalobacter sp. DCM]